jgi:hypothetical protein
MERYSTINYSCGHGSFDVPLYGDVMRTHITMLRLGRRVCPECQEAKLGPITAELIHDAAPGGTYIAITKGDSYHIKGALKAAGCRWREYAPPGDVPAMSTPRKMWMIKVTEDQAAAEIIRKLYLAGVQEFKIDESPLGSIAVQVAREINMHAA